MSKTCKPGSIGVFMATFRKRQLEITSGNFSEFSLFSEVHIMYVDGVISALMNSVFTYMSYLTSTPYFHLCAHGKHMCRKSGIISCGEQMACCLV